MEQQDKRGAILPAAMKNAATPIGKSAKVIKQKIQRTPTFEKKKKKNKNKAKPAAASKTPKKKGKEKKAKKVKKNKPVKTDNENDDSDDSSSEDEESCTPDQMINSQTANVYMSGKLQSQIKHPSDFEQRLLLTERPDLFDKTLTMDECRLLNAYMKKRGELRPQEFIVYHEQETDDDETHKFKLMIVNKYSEGRFGGIYIVQSVQSMDNKTFTVTRAPMMMKTSLRQSSVATNRLTREIIALRNFNDYTKAEKLLYRRVLPILMQGRVLGIPYFITPIMDANLEKVREECGKKFCTTCVCWIAAELLKGIRDMHSKQLVHRDIKPANYVTYMKDPMTFVLIDLGDALQKGSTFLLSPPDGLTLPYLSRTGHAQIRELEPVQMEQDIESWFYILLDLLISLPWRKESEEKAVAATKKEFWKSIEFNLTDYPPFVQQIGDMLAKGAVEFPYQTVFAVLTEYFETRKTPDWKVCWVEQRWGPTKPQWMTPQFLAQMSGVSLARQPVAAGAQTPQARTPVAAAMGRRRAKQ